MLRTLAALDRSRFHPLVLPIAPPCDLVPDFTAAGIEVLPDGNARHPVRAVRRVIRREHVDIVHVHAHADTRAGKWAALLTGTPVVEHLHSMWVHLAPDPASRRAGLALRRFVEHRTVRHYVAASAAVLREYAPYVRAPVTVLPAPVDAATFHRLDARARGAVRRHLALPAEAPVVVNVGRFAPGKGQAAVVEAFAKTLTEVPDAHLVLVGDGPERAAVEARAAMLCSSEQVRFAGACNNPALALGAADAYLDASESEAFGIAVLEAMAAELPVTAYALEPFAEFVPEGAATLVPIGDVDTLAGALTAVLTDPGRAHRAGRTGRAAAEGHTAARAATTLADVYDRVLGRERAGTA